MTTNMGAAGSSPFNYTNYTAPSSTPARKEGYGRSAGELPETPSLPTTPGNPPAATKRDPKVAQELVIAEKKQSPTAQLNNSLKPINSLLEPEGDAGMSAEELVEHASVALEGMEKAAGGLGALLEKTGDISTLADKLSETATVSGLEFLGDGVVMLGLAHSIATYRAGQLSLEEKAATLKELQDLSKAQAALGNDTSGIDRKIGALQHEIVDTAKSQVTSRQEIAMKLATSGCSAVEAGGKLAEVLASAGSAAAAVAPIIEAGASSVGAGVGGVISAFKLSQDMKGKQHVEKKFDEIKAIYDTKTEGTLMHTILGHKLNQLEQERQDILVSALRNYIGVGSSSVGLGVGIATLAGASGAATVGIAPAVLAGTALVIGAGYGVYKHQDSIGNAKDRLATYVPGKINEFAMEYHAGKLLEIRTALTDVEQAEHAQLARQQKLEERLFTPITEKVNKLKMERVTVRDELFRLEFVETEKVQTLAARISGYFESSKKDFLKSRLSTLAAEIEDREGYVEQLRSTESATLASIQSKKLALETEFSEVNAKIKSVGQRVLTYHTEAARLADDKRYIDWAVNIQGVEWQQVRDLHLHVRAELEGDPSALEEIRDFLADQKVEMTAYDSDPATTILDYIAREEVV